MTKSTIYTPTQAVAVTKSDSTIQQYSQLYIGTGGDVAVMPLAQGTGGTAVTFKAVGTGKTIDLVVCKVMSTNTTASNIVGLS